MANYYNENDPKAAAWLRELISQKQIPFGIVDERSILDVTPNDLFQFTQCHFFAGIGGWSYALRLANISSDARLWTGSPPCQPFSVAGTGDGKDDARHLAPHFLDLVRECRPPVLFGEQVASKSTFGPISAASGRETQGPPEWAWIDDVSDRLEAAHYTVGATDIPSAGVGAPHIRPRTFFGDFDPDRTGEWLGDPECAGLQGHQPAARSENRKAEDGSGFPPMLPSSVADTASLGRQVSKPEHPEKYRAAQEERREQTSETVFNPHDTRSATKGFWSVCDWLRCTDERWRPVESGTFPLAHGVPNRMGLLRGYGNAINPWAAKEFIEAFSEAATL